MKVLLIGLGSIGRRHLEVLISTIENLEVHIVTKQTLDEFQTFSSLAEVPHIEEYSYFLITSETSRHFQELDWLNTKVCNKKIFCEKPLFEKIYQLPDLNNEVYVGYVLRFHPALQKMKELLLGQTILTANISCGSYLPNWRPDVDYRQSYSAKRSQGGGVLLDLSHELDYSNWLFGTFTEIKSYQLKLSDLKIDTDDVVSVLGRTHKGALVTLTMDYFCKSPHRLIRVNTNELTLEADLVSNTLTVWSLCGKKDYFSYPIQRNDLFKSMHYEILFAHEKDYVCNFSQGLDVMTSINEIQVQNDG